VARFGVGATGTRVSPLSLTSEAGAKGFGGMWLDVLAVLAGIVAVAVTAGVVWRL
jgi:hypothetical protein